MVQQVVWGKQSTGWFPQMFNCVWGSCSHRFVPLVVCCSLMNNCIDNFTVYTDSCSAQTVAQYRDI